jgi:hypothetical protein
MTRGKAKANVYNSLSVSSEEYKTVHSQAPSDQEGKDKEAEAREREYRRWKLPGRAA